MSKDWYYTKDNEKYGPFEANQIIDLIRSGALNYNTLVWNEGIEEWKPAHIALPDVQEMPPSIPKNADNESSDREPATSPEESQPSSIHILQVIAVVCGFGHLLFVWVLTQDAAVLIRPFFVVLAVTSIVGDFILHKKPSLARWLILIGTVITTLIILAQYPSLSDPVRVRDSGEWVMRDYGSMMIAVLIFTSAQIGLLFIHRQRVNSHEASSS